MCSTFCWATAIDYKYSWMGLIWLMINYRDLITVVYALIGTLVVAQNGLCCKWAPVELVNSQTVFVPGNLRPLASLPSAYCLIESSFQRVVFAHLAIGFLWKVTPLQAWHVHSWKLCASAGCPTVLQCYSVCYDMAACFCSLISQQWCWLVLTLPRVRLLER